MAFETKQTHHRAGSLKQINKAHKSGRHNSKSTIKNANKGKVSVRVASRKKKLELGKEARRNQLTQIRQNKRQDTLATKRSLGSTPNLVCILPLNKHLDGGNVLAFLKQCDEEAVIKESDSGVTHIYIPRLKHYFSFVIPRLDDFLNILDTLKVCDTVIFFVSAVAGFDFGDEVIDNWGNNILMSIFAQGLPTSLPVVTELEGVPPKKRQQQKQNIQKLFSKWLPDEKIVTLDKSTDALNILRKIGNQKRKNIAYRDRRPYIYADRVQYVPDTEDSNTGTLKVTGYLRGGTLSVNDLVHVPGLGDFQMHQIDLPDDLFYKEKSKNKDELEPTKKIVILEVEDPSKQESLEAENIIDPMDAEQTWPTEDDFRLAKEQKTTVRQKVPKGFSDYQANWVIDEMNELDSSASDEESENDGVMDVESENDSDYSDNEQLDTVSVSDAGVNDDKYDDEVDWNLEKNELDKVKAAKSDLEFPDEIDTPQDVPARIRFQKYRGLESFRTSPWDHNDNLPVDYARIINFQNFDATRKVLFKNLKNKDGVQSNWYVTIHIKNVSQELWTNFKSRGSSLILFGLFPYEHKMSVVHTVLKRTPNYTEPIKSKERLIFQCGYRRFIVNPIFSQHTNGNKHKFLRFYQEAVAVATFYAPAQFPPAPVLCYKELNNQLTLVAHGNLLSCDSKRLIIKRAVLSGHPFKIHKSLAVIRFMFFNREDILYFKCLHKTPGAHYKCRCHQLHTKYGQVGHIKEPLGSHGHMKCIFKNQLKSMDTVFMYLYKRVFPKWNYEDCIVTCDLSQNMET